MTQREVCRHGLLTLERDGIRIHAHDGSQCEPPRPASTPAPDAPPEVAPTEVAPTEVAPTEAAPIPVPIVAPEPESVPSEPLAYEAVGASEPLPPATTVVDVMPPPPARRPKRWLPVAALLAVILLVVAGVTGGLIAKNAVDHQKDRAAAAIDRTASLREQVAEKDATIEDQRNQISDYEQQQAALQQREADLARREQALQRPQGPNSTTFGDGLYEVHVAIQPGEYRTDGTDSCYWAKLSTGDTNSIIENDLVAGPQTVTIASPYFESENCGTWTKVTSQ